MVEVKRIYYSAEDISAMLDISVSHRYRIIRRLNKELEEKGFLVISDKLPIRYFEEKYYGLNS